MRRIAVKKVFKELQNYKRAARIILDAPFLTPKQQLFDSKMDIYYY